MSDKILEGLPLWSAQARIPSILGRQLTIEHGEGSHATTIDGRHLFDGTAGFWHANIGHAKPKLARDAHILSVEESK